jgi:hypothetical protein
MFRTLSLYDIHMFFYYDISDVFLYSKKKILNIAIYFSVRNFGKCPFVSEYCVNGTTGGRFVLLGVCSTSVDPMSVILQVLAKHTTTSDEFSSSLVYEQHSLTIATFPVFTGTNDLALNVAFCKRVPRFCIFCTDVLLVIHVHNTFFCKCLPLYVYPFI